MPCRVDTDVENLLMQSAFMHLKAVVSSIGLLLVFTVNSNAQNGFKKWLKNQVPYSFVTIGASHYLQPYQDIGEGVSRRLETPEGWQTLRTVPFEEVECDVFQGVCR